MWPGKHFEKVDVISGLADVLIMNLKIFNYDPSWKGMTKIVPRLSLIKNLKIYGEMGHYKIDWTKIILLVILTTLSIGVVELSSGKLTGLAHLIKKNQKSFYSHSKTEITQNLYFLP